MGIADLFKRDGVIAAALAEPVTSAADRGAHTTFAVGSDYATWQALIGNASVSRVTRDQAMGVPAVVRARDLICNGVSGLPIDEIVGNGQRVENQLLNQPEAPSGRVRTVTISRTVEDLLLDGSCLWLVILRNAAGFPTAIERIAQDMWQQDSTGEIRVNGRVVNPRDTILFESPNDPLLTSGARAIRALLDLERTAAQYADEPSPARSWTSADGIDPPVEDITAFLTAWRDARKARATAYVPSAYQALDLPRLSPEELQLQDARSFCVTEIARLTGVDAEELSVSVTSRTYANITQRRRQFVDFVLSPYLHSIELRLSSGDVCPRGHQVRFNLDAFLRADTTERYAAYEVALRNGFLTLDEVRELEDRAPLGGGAS